MKKLLLLIFLMWWLPGLAQIEEVTPKRPNPPRLVNDLADKLTPEQEMALERKLVAYDDSTSNQIAVVIVQSITDKSGNQYPEEDVALKILRDWQVGTQKNNGIVILIALDERKIRIE